MGCFENAYYTFTVKCCFIFTLYCGPVPCPFYIVLNLYNFFPVKNINALLHAHLTTNLFMCSVYIRMLSKINTMIVSVLIIYWLMFTLQNALLYSVLDGGLVMNIVWPITFAKFKKKNYVKKKILELFSWCFIKKNSLFLHILCCSAISMIGFVNFK